MEFFDQNISIIDNVTELNLSESEYLNLMWGPKHLPLKVVLPITLIYVMIFVTGVFGNVVTCIVIKRNPALQTATNYYLFNLAISDLLLLILGKSYTELSASLVCNLSLSLSLSSCTKFFKIPNKHLVCFSSKFFSAFFILL